MKLLTIFIYFILSINVAISGTCTSISRTSFGANTVLTSSELNNQFNTVYNHTNALDAGCLTDGTLENSALNASDFHPVVNHITGGCKVSYTDSNTVSISKCSATINGNFVNKTTATSLTWGCTDCSSESASTLYYVYLRGTSSGTTVNGLISTTAPDDAGFSGTDRVLARFYNNSTSDIVQYSIDQWEKNSFRGQETGIVDAGAITVGAVTTAPTKGDNLYSDKMTWFRQGQHAVININYNQINVTGGAAGSGNYIFDLPSGLEFKSSVLTASSTNANVQTYPSVYLFMYDAGTGFFHYGEGHIIPYDSNSFTIYSNTGYSTGGTNPSSFQVGSSMFRFDEATSIRGQFTVPIAGFE